MPYFRADGRELRKVPKGCPVLEATRIDGKLLRVWCPYCRRGHIHGGGDRPGDGNGHRVAHCGEGTPFVETGYCIVEATVKEP